MKKIAYVKSADFPHPGTPVRGSRSGAPIMALFDLLGRRWAMGVLWTLRENEPSTFRQLQERCETISPAVLNKRLGELRAAQFVTRGEGGYITTALGRELYDQLVPLGLWSKDWAKALDEMSEMP
ncbi:winged helix-turn-helix transcriptional regulator [Roseibium algae]|uniref:Helix-turn-helix domain-containing protein n=1 Tax=Roseibium algae TaxID=3123038 RepID=A0ABU8TMQ9_9HYPH